MEGTTIKDVARQADVSPATVSRVLNDSSKVREETRLKVVEAIKELEYEVNESARTLRTKTSRLIGVIGARLNNPFLMDLLQAAEAIARKEGFNLLLGDTGDSLLKKIDHLQIMKQKNVDGIIIISSSWQEDFLKELEKSPLPAIIASGHIRRKKISSTGINNRKAAEEVIEYLHENNHNKIGIIRGPLSDKISSEERLGGVKKAFKNLNICWREELCFAGDFSFESGYRGARELIKKEKDLTAIFAFDDRMAIGAMRGAESLGKSIPGDISVVGFDDIELSRFVKPSLTTVHQPCSRLGKAAMKLLISTIEGRSEENKHVQIEHELVKRESTEKGGV